MILANRERIGIRSFRMLGGGTSTAGTCDCLSQCGRPCLDRSPVDDHRQVEQEPCDDPFEKRGEILSDLFRLIFFFFGLGTLPHISFFFSCNPDEIPACNLCKIKVSIKHASI